MSADGYEAVFFCDTKGRIDRQMLYVEFEAMLDSFVPAKENANENVHAVYVSISPQLKIQAAVYFTISFDDDGMADPKWNIPLPQLAREGDKGPNLGDGAIRLACRSQCPVEWHTKALWDPDMAAKPNPFIVLRDAVTENKLMLKVELPVEEDPALTVPMTAVAAEQLAAATQVIPAVQAPVAVTQVAPAVTQVTAAVTGVQPVVLNADIGDVDKVLAANLMQVVRKQLLEESDKRMDELESSQQLLLAAQKKHYEDQIHHLQNEHGEELEKTQQLLQASQKNHYEDKIHNLQSEHSDELRQNQELLERFSSAVELEQQNNEKLQSQLDIQIKAAEQTKLLFEGRLKENQEEGDCEIDALRKNSENEITLKLEQVEKEYQEAFDKKEQEFTKGAKEQERLTQEVENLRTEKASLIKQDGKEFLAKLEENKISFIAYHLGSGNLNIKLKNIAIYLENPMAYVAEACQVTEEIYQQWLAHQKNLFCTSPSKTKEGDFCGKKLKPVDAPSHFVQGRSDRCPLHWSFADDE